MLSYQLPQQIPNTGLWQPTSVEQCPACFYHRKYRRRDRRAELQRISTQYVDFMYKIFLTPSNSRYYKVPESHILSRAFTHCPCTGNNILVHQPRALAPHSHIPSVLPTSWAFTLCLSEPCGSVAGLFSLIILWILGTLPKTWFCADHTAPHSHSR